MSVDRCLWRRLGFDDATGYDVATDLATDDITGDRPDDTTRDRSAP